MAKFLGGGVALALEKMSSRSQYCSGMGVSLVDGSKESLGMPLSTRGAVLGKNKTVWMPSHLCVHQCHMQNQPSLAVDLNKGLNGACLDSIYLIQLSIYPPGICCAPCRSHEGT